MFHDNQPGNEPGLFYNSMAAKGIQKHYLLRRKLDKKTQQVIAPRVASQYAPRQRQLNLWRIYVRPQTNPQSAHLWWPTSCRIYCQQPRQLRHAASRRYPRVEQTDGRIAVSLNAPLWRGHKNSRLGN